MSNNLSVSDITPLGERPADVWRGRTGVLGAGVFTLFGSDLAAEPTLTGDFYTYDPATGTWIISNTGSIGSTIYLTKYAGGGHDKYTNLAATGAVTIDCSLANIFDFTLTGNITITITNPPSPTVGAFIWVVLRQGGSGSYSVTWPVSVVWQATDGTATGSAPTLHTVVTAEDVVTLATLDGGTTWGGELGGGSSGVTGFAAPALTLSTTNSAGAATTAIRSDATVAVFDATVPVTQALGDTAATGSAAITARRDHKHGMPALSTATPLVASGSGATGTGTLSSREDHVHPSASGGITFTVIGQETRTSDGSTTTYLLDNDYDDNSVEAFNLTSGKALVVTENGTNSVTIGAAGTAGDTLAFAYAALAA